MINGDVGTYPITGAAIHLTQAQVNGTIHSVDAAGPAGSVIDPALLLAAKGDLTTAYNEAADRIPIPTGPFLDPGAGNLGGLNLIPGLYKFTGTAMLMGSSLTLTGGPDDVWIFQVLRRFQWIADLNRKDYTAGTRGCTEVTEDDAVGDCCPP